MEYFDFEGASHGSQAQQDDVASNCIEFDNTDAAANFESFFQDQSLELPNDDLPDQVPARQQVEGDASGTAQDTVVPMSIFNAREPCDFCRHMRLDCFVANQGVMQNSCTCCISLYRECSFTHAKAPGKFLDTLHPVSENVCVLTGGLTSKRALKSVSGVTPFEDPDTRLKKSSARFSRDAVRILKTWLREHSQHPYPTELEKDDLEQRTGLKRIQIGNWLANARRRGKLRSPSPVQGAVDIPGRNIDTSLMTPLERWKHSPPENEPASRTDILRALENTPVDTVRRRPSGTDHVRSVSRKTGSTSNDSTNNAKSNMFHTPSASSFETSQSSLSDLSFTLSHRSSMKSSSSMDRKERRRRRKPPPPPVNTLNQQKSRNARIFQCTFCSDSFPAKYDWQRHEKSLHLALDKWTCSAEGGVILVNGTNVCVFCKAPNPDNDHLESHNYSTCQEKSPQERTFYRKDHLNQHLRLIHNVKYDSSMEKWRSSTTEVKSRCGFCGATFSTWKERVDHLASHFKKGADMAQWQGDWGFEPWVQELVENAMPPYLIGQERKTMDPFIASHRHPGILGNPDNDSSPGLGVLEDSPCAVRLQHELTAFIHSQVAAGIIPTDQMIQDEGRKIIYGSNDRWNQTCADNPVWLSILKRDAGLEVVPGPDHIQASNPAMQPPFAMDGGLRLPRAETNPLARTISSRALNSAGFSGSGFQSPAFPQSSGASSVPSSMTGSYVDSVGAVSAGPPLMFPTDWGASVSAGASSSSVLVHEPVDPLTQISFDPEFLQRLNEGYGDLHGDDIDGMDFEAFNDDHGGGQQRGEFFPTSESGSAPIPIPNVKHAGIPLSDPHQPNLQRFSGSSYHDLGGL